MRRATTVLVLVVGMAFSARAAEGGPISFPAFTDPCLSGGSSTCTSSTDSPTEAGTQDGFLTNPVLPSTFNTSSLTQPLTLNDSSLLISLNTCESNHSCTPQVVPEPASLILFGTGLTALAARLRHRRRRQDP